MRAQLTKQSAIQLSKNSWTSSNSKCLKQEFFITKENRQCKLCVPNKTIQFQLIKNGQAQNSKCLQREFFPSRKKTESANNACLTKNPIPIDNEYLDKLKIPNASSKNFLSQKNTDSANHAGLTIQSYSNLIAQTMHA